MAWQMKAEKSGKVYDFADDVGEADASAYIDSLERDATYSEAFSAGVAQVRPQAAKFVAGMKQAAGDLLRQPEWSQEATMTTREANADIAANTPANMSIGQKELCRRRLPCLRVWRRLERLHLRAGGACCLMSCGGPPR
jgi:hypothetical protein